MDLYDCTVQVGIWTYSTVQGGLWTYLAVQFRWAYGPIWQYSSRRIMDLCDCTVQGGLWTYMTVQFREAYGPI